MTVPMSLRSATNSSAFVPSGARLAPAIEKTFPILISPYSWVSSSNTVLMTGFAPSVLLMSVASETMDLNGSISTDLTTRRFFPLTHGPVRPSNAPIT